MPNLLAVDVGYSQVKVVDDRGSKYLFPSFVDRSFETGIKLGGGMDETVMTCGGICQSKSYVVGGNSSSSLNLAANFHGTPEWYALMCKAFFDHLGTLDGKVTDIQLDYLGIGVPLDQRKSEKIKEMEQFNSFEFSVDGISYTAKADKVVVFPQGMAMLQEVDFHEDEEIGLIDIGYKTLDVMVLDGGSLVSDSYTSLSFGVKDILGKIKDQFKAKTGATLSDRRAQKLLRTKKQTYAKETIHMAKEVKEISEEYWNNLLKEIRPFWGEIEMLDRIVVGGGGAVLLGDIFKSKLAGNIQVEIMDDPVFGNVTGYMKSLRSLAGE